MSETVRKTYQEKLRPTPAQERELEHVMWRCRTLSAWPSTPSLQQMVRVRVSLMGSHSLTSCQNRQPAMSPRRSFDEYLHVGRLLCYTRLSTAEMCRIRP